MVKYIKVRSTWRKYLPYADFFLFRLFHPYAKEPMTDQQKLDIPVIQLPINFNYLSLFSIGLQTIPTIQKRFFNILNTSNDSRISSNIFESDKYNFFTDFKKIIFHLINEIYDSENNDFHQNVKINRFLQNTSDFSPSLFRNLFDSFSDQYFTMGFKWFDLSDMQLNDDDLQSAISHTYQKYYFTRAPIVYLCDTTMMIQSIQYNFEKHRLAFAIGSDLKNKHPGLFIFLNFDECILVRDESTKKIDVNSDVYNFYMIVYSDIDESYSFNCNESSSRKTRENYQLTQRQEFFSSLFHWNYKNNNLKMANLPNNESNQEDAEINNNNENNENTAENSNKNTPQYNLYDYLCKCIENPAFYLKGDEKTVFYANLIISFTRIRQSSDDIIDNFFKSLEIDRDEANSIKELIDDYNYFASFLDAFIKYIENPKNKIEFESTVKSMLCNWPYKDDYLTLCAFTIIANTVEKGTNLSFLSVLEKSSFKNIFGENAIYNKNFAVKEITMSLESQRQLNPRRALEKLKKLLNAESLEFYNDLPLFPLSEETNIKFIDSFLTQIRQSKRYNRIQY
ncbi:hypothetical protein TRFO_01733 [Tritrichomonas foetus]|uniref:Uncharacterized protein n=1 Tax=Tritrichomonas foetus TaxID=1144522 RepID=A0A1J4JPQ8_9EUKA|nr:hypothetical protein TRFO_01733 [Tritrichomonas foetus]|eukprot:OHT01135.1 hypothetical protein TRFO_01733 [Tritrichomonas foetus]